MKERERVFFSVNNMTAWELTSICILQLFKTKPTKEMHGSFIRKELSDIYNNTWIPGNDLLYTILNAYEEYGYLKSRWEKEEDIKKRYKRKYKITDAGLEYLNIKKKELHCKLKDMNWVLEKSSLLIWGDLDTLENCSEETISQSVFTELNALYFLSNNNKVHARKIKIGLRELYQNKWEPSDGVLYPILSTVQENQYVDSNWVKNEHGNELKKKTIRNYSITTDGSEHFNRLKASSIKNKIIRLSQMAKKTTRFIEL